MTTTNGTTMIISTSQKSSSGYYAHNKEDNDQAARCGHARVPVRRKSITSKEAAELFEVKVPPWCGSSSSAAVIDNTDDSGVASDDNVSTQTEKRQNELNFNNNEKKTEAKTTTTRTRGRKKPQPKAGEVYVANRHQFLLVRYLDGRKVERVHAPKPERESDPDIATVEVIFDPAVHSKISVRWYSLTYIQGVDNTDSSSTSRYDEDYYEALLDTRSN